MSNDTERKRSTVQSFAGSASEYLDSRVHKSGEDLQQLGEWCKDATRALDVATGAGHTAGAIADRGVDEVLAVDATAEMVRTTVEEFDVDGAVADAEQLPFDADVFDAVACRIAAHHFPNPEAFVEEVARVTAPGGIFAFEDNIAPEDEILDEFLNEVERLRDPSHVRSYRESEWRSWIESAGFGIDDTRQITKTIDYNDWVEQLDTPEENRRELEDLFSDPPEDAAELYGITYDDAGDVTSFANLKLLCRARLSD